MSLRYLRARLAWRELPRPTRRRLGLDAPPAPTTPQPASQPASQPAASPRPPRMLIDLTAAPSGMEQRAAGWAGR